MAIKKCKIIALVLCLALCLVFLVGCSNNDSSSNNIEVSNTTPVSEEPTVATAKEEEIPVPKAPEFSLRGGINFNSTKDSILEYEKTQGGRIKEYTAPEHYFTDNCIQVSDISFAGYDDTIVVYYFDKNDKLSSILYIFHQSVDDRSPADKQFGIIDDGLAKYGNPIASGKEFLDINDAYDVIDYINCSTLQDITSDAKVDTLAFSQRLIKIDNGYIDIKDIEFLWSYTMNLGGYNFPSKQYSVAVSYSFCTNEEIKAVENKILEKKNAVENDL